jgi:DNA-binding SARP family transcriptional activator
MRSLLAYLLLHANELVSSDRLIDEVWGPEPPKTAAASLQNYVSRLRRAIGPELIVSQPPGYVLRVDPERFDLTRFERLTAEARGASPRERAETLRAALGLWRGPALEDLAFEPFARDEVGRLEEARLGALEEWMEAELALGKGEEVVAELEELVDNHPLRERFRRQLMRALYQAGRQADALAAYQDARSVLMDELGLEPSTELRALQQAILHQDPSLGGSGETDIERAPDRRTVTVLFCDLVDSSRLAAELDPEVYRRVMSRYFDTVRVPIERHGGTVEKFIGDAVMAVFGVPNLHEDDALRALRAAADVQASLREVGDIPVTARIGISTGEVHVLSSSAAALHVSGAAASVASQLEGRAPAGGVLLSDETYRLVRDAVRAEPAEDAWRLEEVLPDAPAYARRLDAPLVGRTHELQRLQSAWKRVHEDKHCRVVTVVGEAGIGKTRLAREFVSSVRDEAQVLVGRCVSYGEGATYLPIAEIVKGAATEPSVKGIRELLEGEEDADAVSERVAALIGIVESPAAPGEAFWAVRRLLESLAHQGPVVAVLDDIHWAEPTLLDLVEYLGEWAEGAILVLCLARGDLLDTRPGWGGPRSTGFLVDLEPLPEQTLGRLVQQLSSTPLAKDVQAHVIEHAGGNPLFAEQLLALTAEAPGLALDKPPATVEALLASRLDRLEAPELGVLRRAAVVGRRFSRAELNDLSPDHDTDRHLMSLTERNLVQPEQEVFRFHHVLVRDVAYRGIPKADRAELHELAGQGLDRRDGADELVGYHFEQAFQYLIELAKPDAHALEVAERGAHSLGSAGIRAWKRADVPAAINLLSRSLELEDDGRLACELGVALHASGDLPRAQTIFARLTDAADQGISLRARIEHGFQRSLVEPDRAGELLEVATAAVPLLEQAGDDRALGRAWLTTAHVRGGFYCEYAAMEKAAERAVACYGRSGWSASTALDYLGTALYFGPRSVRDAIARCQELLHVHQTDPASEANIEVWLGGLEAMRGNFELAREHMASARSGYRKLGLTIAVVDHCGRALAAIELLANSPETAEGLLRECCATLESSHQTSLLATRAAELAGAIYEQGRYDEAAAWTRVAHDCAGDDDLDAALARQPVEAKILARQGAVSEAEDLIRATLELVSRTDALNRHGDAFLALAEVLEEAGRESEACEALKNAVALYEQKGNVVSAERLRSRLPRVTLTE